MPRSWSQRCVGRLALPCALTLHILSQADTAKEDDICRLDFPLEPSDSSVSSESGIGTAEAIEWEDLVEQLVYKKGGISGYMTLPEEELANLNVNFTESGDRRCKPATFGELDSVKIFKNEGFHLGEEDYFMDLGSGVGKAVIHASLLFNASVSVGVELSEARFRESCRALARLEAILRSASCGDRCRERIRRPGRIEMRRANVLDTDLSNVTAIMMYSNCFPTEVQTQLQRKLILEPPLGARVQTLDTTGWDKLLALEGRTLELARGIGMLMYTVETVTPGSMQDIELQLRQSDHSEEL
eukprot:gnl/TRDRNA2_/TRDRNA2_173603_c0_seq1.p1 gnl/TRDRNA2_/TRDRNA2_173603_c0~~gnl/TRDRNA2_/TRDRNA2_173603_c0_seq1.p1  ORF type:complete len:300 (-),score=54.34 gnl/TRDRNA2_/TRDRNA2_173603_c0_seq1:55-954(-)